MEAVCKASNPFYCRYCESEARVSIKKITKYTIPINKNNVLGSLRWHTTNTSSHHVLQPYGI